MKKKEKKRDHGGAKKKGVGVTEERKQNDIYWGPGRIGIVPQQ